MTPSCMPNPRFRNRHGIVNFLKFRKDFSAKLALFVEISTLFRIIYIIGKIVILTTKIKLNNIKIFFEVEIKNSSRISN